MPKSKWNLNTIYISERLQESLRPISRCAMTTVVAPMGYGKTTAVEWYLAERARAEAPYIVRISVYSSNLAILEKCAGRLCACRLCLSAGIRLSDRRSERRTADRRSVSCADR